MRIIQICINRICIKNYSITNIFVKFYQYFINIFQLVKKLWISNYNECFSILKKNNQFNNTFLNTYKVIIVIIILYI